MLVWGPRECLLANNTRALVWGPTHALVDLFVDGSGLYAIVKKLNDEDLIKVIEGFRSIIININFLFHPLLHLFIGIYYDKSKPCNYFNYLL
jgi:hypothetical protein